MNQKVVKFQFYSLPTSMIPICPFLGVPQLLGYLREIFNSKQVDFGYEDLNLKLFEFVVDANQLKKSYKEIINNFLNLNKKKLFSEEERKIYKKLFDLIIQYEKIKDTIKLAVSYLRSGNNGTYEKERYSIAINLIHKAYKFYFYNSDIANNLFFNFTSGIKTLKDLNTAINSKRYSKLIEFYIQDVIPNIRKNNYNIIGVSISYINQIIPAILLSKLIKENFRNILIIAGGSFFSHFFDREISQEYFKWFDIIVIGEGENPLKTIIENYLNNISDFNTKEGICYKKNGFIFYPNKPAVFKNLNNLPFPDFSDIDLNMYLSPESILPVQISRGCYWQKCNFCNHSKSYSNQYRCSSIENIIRQLIFLNKKYAIKYFVFVDEAISINQLNVISNKILLKGLKIKFGTMSRLNGDYSNETFRKIKKAGCDFLSFGMESAVDRVLTLMNKGIKRKDIYNILLLLKKNKIKCHLMFFIGFPGEKEDEAEETFNFIINNKNNISLIGFHKFALLKGSNVYNNPEYFGIKIKEKHKKIFSEEYRYISKEGLQINEIDNILEKYYKNKVIQNLSLTVISREHLFFNNNKRIYFTNRYSLNNYSKYEIIKYFMDFNYKKRNKKEFSLLDKVINNSDSFVIVNGYNLKNLKTNKKFDDKITYLIEKDSGKYYYVKKEIINKLDDYKIYIKKLN